MAGLPPALRRGDRVRLVAASSALADVGRLQQGVAVLQSWGLTVEMPFDPARRWGYLAGHDLQRRADLQPAPLLACVRGGWGAARLLEQPLPEADGWLLGFSDVTSLLWARQARGQAGGVHGPLVTTLAAEPDWSRERLRRLLFGAPVPPLTGDTWCAGVAEGPLLVGNLTVATHLLGTPHLPALDGAILVLEDVGEAPYRIERMLTHWRLCGALQRLAGIGFGSFEACDDPESGAPAAGVAQAQAPQDTDQQAQESPALAPQGQTLPVNKPPTEGSDLQRPQAASQRFSLEQVLRERTADLGIPVLAGLPLGHAPGNGALPLGVRARLGGGALSLLP
ncbi:LD-carboxypeptidase [Synechococcus sp. ATX 2A4]|uniref:S66 peptidase family protein n=1 Tax=Synechococcus sp. ATX 2A4 TaxID=2823727 RepID=UPI0020CCAD44|nr:LD-carboxypeptidase [Synechococcus sp. ATX 2A4]